MTATSSPSPRGRILVVDDEDPVANLLVMLFTGEGYQVERAAGFAQVKERFAAGSFDLVTLDIIMPGASGIEVLRWLRQHHPDAGVVMATALGDLDTVLEAMRLGAQNYIIKPFNLDLISQEIARAMERQRLVAENRSYQAELEQKVAEQTQQLRDAYARLERQVRELEGRDRLVQLQLDGAPVAQAHGGILEVFAKLVPGEGAVLYRAGAEGGLQAVAPAGSPPAPPEVVEAHREGQAVDSGTGLALPLRCQGEALGVLHLARLTAADEVRPDLVAAAERLAAQAAVLLWAARVGEELDSGQVQVDELLRLR